ncbi:MAG: sigma factor-like helix-turn-helix DNA-binding protein [Varibaculum cambriense]|nr:sigma factor-like helix-turn-helix DNA-binding protein [Varibaculum cambriense]MDU5316503.1 sigma factor-like helix-turn-helix DNA-binding protein [Varibaculum cambriense]
MKGRTVTPKDSANGQKTKQQTRAATAARAAQRAERRKKVFDLRLKGQSIYAIAAELGVSVNTVRSDLKRTLDKIPKQDAKTLYTLQLERYDSLLFVVMNQALTGDQYAVDRAVNIMRQIERLTGIEHPQETDNATINATQALKSLAETINKLADQ